MAPFSRFREIPLLARAKRHLGAALTATNRWRLGRAYLRGAGIEIGALHAPFRVPAGARVTYVDRLPVSELRHHYPELAAFPLVDPVRIDDAETLATFASASQDFVIASHILEHCEDPVGAVCAWLRVVKPGGIVLLAVPDKRYTFDSARPLTPLSHVLRDHSEGPAVSRLSHYEEWARLVEGTPAGQLASRAAELHASGYRIHFHVWDFDAFSELLDCCASRFATARIAKISRNRSENLAVLVRTPGHSQ